MEQLFDDLEDFGSFDDAISGDVRDPYTELARLRREEPVQRLETSGALPHEESLPMFIVYRHEDVQQMLRDNETFSSSAVIAAFGPVLGEGVMLGMDEPIHGRLRSLVSKAFSQKSLARWQDELVGRVANSLIPITEPGRCDRAHRPRRGFVPVSKKVSPYLTVGAAISAAAGLIITGTPLAAPAPRVHVDAVRLTSGDGADSPLGDGTALIVGATGLPTPSQGYEDAYDALYLQPRDFGGTLQSLTTPESLYPFTFPFSETFDASTTQGVADIVNAVTSQIAAGGVDAANPVVVTGYSQGATLDSLAMSQLAADGVPSDEVHFVMLGDPNAPNGGLLERFDLPAGTNPEAPSLGLTFSGATPSDLYPADIYTAEYDGFVDFPKYPINIVSDLNAYLGILFNHTAYLGFTPEQVSDAIQLPTSTADTMVNYYLIPSDSLPLLDPLRLVPFLGNPLADLVQPDLSVLVNLGYGDVADNYLGGFSPGDADVATPLSFLPPQSVLDQVPQALANGLQQGLQDAFKDLTDPSNYQLYPPETMSAFGPLLGLITAGGDLNDPSDFPHFLSAELTGIEYWFTQGVTELSLTHTGIPALDMASTVLFTLPQIAENIFETEMAAGDPVDAIGDPLAVYVGLAPLILVGALF